MVKYTPVSGIYIIVNTKNSNVYIGQTQDFRFRFRKHKELLVKDNHSNRHLQFAWNKYGGKSFKFKILEYCSVESLNEREQHYLDIYMPRGLCYNIAKDVRLPMRGKTHSPEARAKISAALRVRVRKPITEETRQKMSDSAKKRKASPETIQKMKAKRLTPETKKKIGDAQRGRPGKPHSEETRRKIGEAGKGRVTSEETKKKLSIAGRGRVVSEETRKKLSLAHMGRKMGSPSQETIEKMRSSQLKRKPISEETRIKMSESAKRRYQKKDTDN